MDNYFEVIDPLGRPITLKTDTYNIKIANFDGLNDDKKHGNSHPDITVKNIKDSVEHPHYITCSHRIEKNGEDEVKIVTDERQEYYRLELSEEKTSIFKTIVEFDDNNKGDVVTSFRNNRASSIKVEGGIIYDATEQ